MLSAFLDHKPKFSLIYSFMFTGSLFHSLCIMYVLSFSNKFLDSLILSCSHSLLLFFIKSLLCTFLYTVSLLYFFSLFPLFSHSCTFHYFLPLFFYSPSFSQFFFSFILYSLVIVSIFPLSNSLLHSNNFL